MTSSQIRERVDEHQLERAHIVYSSMRYIVPDSRATSKGSRKLFLSSLLEGILTGWRRLERVLMVPLVPDAGGLMLTQHLLGKLSLPSCLSLELRGHN